MESGGRPPLYIPRCGDDDASSLLDIQRPSPTALCHGMDSLTAWSLEVKCRTDDIPANDMSYPLVSMVCAPRRHYQHREIGPCLRLDRVNQPHGVSPNQQNNGFTGSSPITLKFQISHKSLSPHRKALSPINNRALAMQLQSSEPLSPKKFAARNQPGGLLDDNW